MSVAQFCEQLRSHLTFLGRAASYTDYGSTRNFTLNSTDASASGTVVDVSRGRDNRVEDQVLFLGSHFKPTKSTGKYDIDRAVGLLLRHEAATREARLREQEIRKKQDRYRNRAKIARKVNDKVNIPGLTLATSGDWDDECYNITVKVPAGDNGPEDEALLGALVDYVQDDPFILTRNIPTSETDRPLTIKEELLKLISSNQVNEFDCERLFEILNTVLEDRKE